MHQFSLRVYYEDTDLAGIVYYANYLKYIERARSEWLREVGVDQVALKAGGTVFAVRHLEADYISPARFDDLLQVESTVHGVTAARLVMDQQVQCAGRMLFAARVTLVCLGRDGRPRRLPPQLAQRLA